MNISEGNRLLRELQKHPDYWGYTRTSGIRSGVSFETIKVYMARVHKRNRWGLPIYRDRDVPGVKGYLIKATEKLTANKSKDMAKTPTTRKKKTTSARKLCSKVIAREGVKANGQLKKGYRWKKGSKGVAVKATTKTAAKRPASSSKRTAKRKTATTKPKIRKHEGINQRTGRLKKGWKYKNGTPVRAAARK